MIANVIINAMMYNSGDASSVIDPVSEKLYFIDSHYGGTPLNGHPSMTDTCDVQWTILNVRNINTFQFPEEQTPCYSV